MTGGVARERTVPATVPSVLVEAWLPRAARRHPDRLAVNALTYSELLAEVDATARRLAGRGVGAGDRVALALPPGETFCVALHAILRIGAVAVPVDLRLRAPERARATEGTVATIDGPVIGTPAAEARLRDRHDLDAPAIIVYTSGTSGRPKPVELTYGNWLWSALGSAVALGLDPAERWLCALPLTHVGGLSIVLRSAIYATTAVVHERFETDRVLDALMAHDGPTIVSLVPTTLQRLLDAGLRDPPSLRWALLGGAPSTTALQGRAAAAGVRVAPTYGLTEACSQVTTLGAPLFCTRVRIATDKEILVSGPTVAPSSGPVLATGDLGDWSSDGALRVVGRKADTIISGGENVAPAEIEAGLEAHPDVVEAAVHGRPDPVWGEAVVATVVADPGVEAYELVAWCSSRLASYKVPKEIAFTAALPRTGSGKLLRQDLRSRSTREQGTRSPGGETRWA
jgi:o-succinylbenzoate---CoA ligase